MRTLGMGGSFAGWRRGPSIAGFAVVSGACRRPRPPPPLAAGALVSGLLLALLVAVEVASGDLARVVSGEAPRYKLDEYVFSTVLVLLVGYMPAAQVYAVAGCRRCFELLRPALRGSPAELDAAGAGIVHFDPGMGRRAGLCGAGLALLVPFAIDLSIASYSLRELNFTALMHRLLLFPVGWLCARQLYAMIAGSWRLARVARDRARVDLLDLSPLEPLARLGLRNALLTMGLLSIVAVATAAWGTRPGLSGVLLGGFALMTAVGAAGLALPVRGAREAIRAVKRAELAWCNEAVRQRRASLRHGAGPEGPRLDEMLAYRSQVESVREWPFDASTLTRFLLYLAIPVGSWLGGALVERGLDSFLD